MDKQGGIQVQTIRIWILFLPD